MENGGGVKVYVVMGWMYPDYHIIAVFSDQAAAERHVADLRVIGEEVLIEEWQLS